MMFLSTITKTAVSANLYSLCLPLMSRSMSLSPSHFCLSQPTAKSGMASLVQMSSYPTLGGRLLRARLPSFPAAVIGPFRA